MSKNNYQEQFDSLKQFSDSSYLDAFTQLISRILYERDTFVGNSDNQEAREAFYQLLREKIEEVYRSYQERNPDAFPLSKTVSFIGEGHTSLAFQIGDMVLKVGKSNAKSNLNQVRDFRCLIPVLSYDESKVSDREYYSIQVSPYVSTNQLSEEELYQTYKELRKEGYIWNDPTPDNTGRFVFDFDYMGHHYQKGDLVIIDLEDLAYVGETVSDDVLDEISMMSYNRKTYVYEMRYIEEKGKAK